MNDEREPSRKGVVSSAGVTKPRALRSDTGMSRDRNRRLVVLVLGMMLIAISVLASVVLNDAPNDPSKRATMSDVASWIFTTVDSSGDVGLDTSIAVDSNNKVHMGYYDRTNDDLKYATNAGGSWANYTLDSAGNVGLSTSIAVDSHDKVHISYLDWTNGDLKYVTNAGGSWTCYTLDSVGNVGLYTSIAVDSHDKVHISYLDWTNDDLKYATNAGGSWAYYTLDSTGDVGYDTSIAVDSNNKVHISYGDWTNDDLKYATNAAGSWASYTLDSTGYVGYDTSIAVDSNDNVHISYHDETNACLKYATNVGGSWVNYTLDSIGDVGLSTSIAVDSNDKVHISYCDYSDFTDGDLKYATNASGSWVYYTLDSIGDVGFDTSIALDSNNMVHIGYSDYTNDDLRYAFGTEEEVPALVVSISAAPAPGQSSLTFQFMSNVSGGVEPYTYLWTFGDGSTNSSQNPVHTYAQLGKYTVTLVVTDSLLNSKSVQKTMRVTAGHIVPVPGDSAAALKIAAGAVVGLVVIVIVALVLMARRTAATIRGLQAHGSKEPAVLVARPSEARTQQSKKEESLALRGQALGPDAPRLTRVEDKLFRLRSMKEKGLISEEEYEEKTKDLLKRW